MILTATALGGSRMNCFLICSLVGAGGVGSRGDFLVCWEHKGTGILLFIGCRLLLTAGFTSLTLFFMTFDGLESGAGCALDCLGSGTEGVTTASCMFIVLQGPLTVGTGV